MYIFRQFRYTGKSNQPYILGTLLLTTSVDIQKFKLFSTRIKEFLIHL